MPVKKALSQTIRKPICLISKRNDSTVTKNMPHYGDCKNQDNEKNKQRGAVPDNGLGKHHYDILQNRRFSNKSEISINNSFKKRNQKNRA